MGINRTSRMLHFELPVFVIGDITKLREVKESLPKTIYKHEEAEDIVLHSSKNNKFSHEHIKS